MIQYCRNLLALLCLSGIVASVYSQQEWVWKSPLPQGNPLNSMVWSGTQYVVVGKMGAISVSRDGKAWMNVQSGTNHELKSVVWTGAHFVAVGYHGTILTSTDGIRWQPQNSGTEDYLISVAWNGHKLIAAGAYSGTILVSADGITWQLVQNLRSAELRSIVWADSQFVGVGQQRDAFGDAIILSSPDGISWTRREPAKIALLECVIWNGKIALAVGCERTVVTSVNNHVWRKVEVGVPGTVHSFALWTGSSFVIGGSGDSVYVSRDAVNWKSFPVTRRITCAIRAGNKYYALANNEILSSTDALTWNKVSIGDTRTLNAIAMSGKQFVAVGNQGAIQISRDGDTWTTTHLGQYPKQNLSSVTWAGDQFIAVGETNTGADRNAGTILTSPDGVIWSDSVLQHTYSLRSVVWTGKQIVAVGGSIVTSPDGHSWTVIDPGLKGSYVGASSVVWTGSLLVAACAEGVILTSEDGSKWTQQKLRTSVPIRSLHWNGKQLIAWGRHMPLCCSEPSMDTLVLSSDAKSWNVREAKMNDIFYSTILWTGRSYLSIGHGGCLSISSDGLSWDLLSQSPSCAIESAVWAGTRLITVGRHGSILSLEMDRP